MKLSDRRFSDLLEAFRAPEPTPGGGSASALTGAVGAALLAMVASLDKSRAETAEDSNRLRAAGEKCASLSQRLSDLIDEDSRAYDAVVAVMRASGDALEQGVVVTQFGNLNARSDAQVGVELLRAAVRGAKLNVEINLESLKDNAYVSAVRAEADRLAASAS